MSEPRSIEVLREVRAILLAPFGKRPSGMAPEEVLSYRIDDAVEAIDRLIAQELEPETAKLEIRARIVELLSDGIMRQSNDIAAQIGHPQPVVMPECFELSRTKHIDCCGRDFFQRKAKK